MNTRERFLAFANFKPLDTPPRYAEFVDPFLDIMIKHLGESPFMRFRMDLPKGARLQPPADYQAPDFSHYYPGHTIGQNGFSLDSNGVGHLNHGFHHFTEYISPLRNATRFEELEQYPVIDKTGWSDQKMIEAGKAAQKQGFYTATFTGHMYEDAWQIRGYEEFLMDLLTQPEWAEYLLDKFCANNIRAATAAARAGYDCIQTGDDVANQNAMMFQPSLWRQIMKPRWAKVIAAARAIKPDIHVWYHSDGNIWDILDDLVEIGITILNPVQPECVDPVAIRKRFGRRLAFDGCLGTQTTFPFGSVEDMHRTVRHLAEALDAKNGGLMLSPTHVLEPEVPPQNVVAFFDACDQL